MNKGRGIVLLGTESGTAAGNMALDEALFDAVAAGTHEPFLRFYTWSPPAVTIGFSLDAAAEVDLAGCAAAGVHVARRITGGGAVFHEREITYSMAVPSDWFSGGIEGSYADICGAMAEGLGFLQKGFEFSPVNDIIYKDKKVSGSAQARRGGCLLQHGTVLLETDLEKMFTLLKVPVEKTRRHGLDAPRRRVATLSEITGRRITFEEAAGALINGFERRFEIIAMNVPVSNAVSEAAEGLEKKYGSDEWNLGRDPSAR